MTQADPIRIRNLLGHIAESQRRLRELGSLPKEAFVGDYRNTESAKYLFVVATEAAIDICNHIVAREGGRAPDAYADCFAVLVDLGVLGRDLGESLQAMARFRNLLVHLYGQVDDGRVYDIIHENLGDLDAFRSAILEWLGV